MLDTFKAYIGYDEYVELGGKVSATAFPILERKAQRYLDNWTQERLVNMDDIPVVVKEALTEMINSMNEDSSGDRLTNFSNGKVSMSFDVSMPEEQKMYSIITMILPLKYTSRAVE